MLKEALKIGTYATEERPYGETEDHPIALQCGAAD